MRLGDFENEPFCDYGTASCQRFQYFRIAEKKVHSDYKLSPRRENDIALLKLDRDIVLGPKMQPVCLPFGQNKNISEPYPSSLLTLSGWWNAERPKDDIAKRSATVGFDNTTICHEANPDKATQVCGYVSGLGPCTVELGSPLMYMFLRRRLVLEGFAYGNIGKCPGTDVGTLYTQVRSYEIWIENSIKKLEAKTTSKVKS